MGNRPHFMADTCNQTSTGHITITRHRLCLDRVELLCIYSLPRHLQVCVYVQYTWHQAVQHRLQRVGRSRPGSPRDWCCPGPLSHLEGWSSPGEQGRQRGVTQRKGLPTWNESQADSRQALVSTYFNHEEWTHLEEEIRKLVHSVIERKDVQF